MALFSVVFDGDGLLLVDKSAGLPVHATRDPNRPHLEGLVQAAFPDRYLRLVNRIDVETSGLVVFCTDASMNAEVDRWMKEAQKFYVALASGAVSEKSFKIHNYLKEDKSGIRSVRSGGQVAVTHFRTIESSNDFSLMAALLDTGRRHQIRVHLSELGHPLLGDKTYGTPSKLINRCALHSHHLHIPAIGKSFTTPLPEDMSRVIENKGWEMKKVAPLFL